MIEQESVKDQISFAEWLKIKLNEHNRRANLYIRNIKNAL